MANVSPAGAAQEYGALITQALSLETANAGFPLVPQARCEAARADLGIAASDLASGPGALAVARAVEAAVAATGLYRLDDDRLVIELKFYDVQRERLITAVVKTGRAGLAVYNLVSDAMLEAQVPLTEWLASAAERESGVAPRARMLSLMSPDEGSDIFVAGRHVTTIIDGRGLLPSATADSVLFLESRKAGFHARSQRIKVPGGGPAEARLEPMVPQTRWAGEAMYTSGQLVGVGLGARYYISPDKLYLSGDTYLYAQSTFSGDSTVFHGDLRFLAGRYLFLGPYSPVRMGFAAGFGGIFSFSTDRGAGSALDVYVSPANLWIEWNRRRWSVYGRIEGKYAGGSGFLPEGWLEVGGGGPPMTIGVVYKW